MDEEKKEINLKSVTEQKPVQLQDPELAKALYPEGYIDTGYSDSDPGADMLISVTISFSVPASACSSGSASV